MYTGYQCPSVGISPFSTPLSVADLPYSVDKADLSLDVHVETMIYCGLNSFCTPWLHNYFMLYRFSFISGNVTSLCR